MEEFIEGVTRELSLFETKAWYEGESKELEKWIGFGFYNTLCISKKGVVTFYYNSEEAEKFLEILKEKLTKEFFDELCENFFELIEMSTNTNEEIYNLYVKIFPVLTIFDEISKYPEIVNEDIIRRLVRVKKTTEVFVYDLMEKIELKEEPKDYIIFKDNLYT